MSARTGAVTFEPIARLPLPDLTFLQSPLNILIDAMIGALVGVNMAITYIALGQQAVCSFNRSAGFLTNLPAIVLVLGLQVSCLFNTVIQARIPVSACCCSSPRSSSWIVPTRT